MTEPTSPIDSPHFHASTTGNPASAQIPANEQELTSAEEEEMLRRIEACIAACDGISTEELEQGVVQDMQRVLKEVAPIVAEWSQDQQSKGSIPQG